MKDVENLFKRLGTSSDYKDFGPKVLDDVRQKWPLLDDVTEAEKSRHPRENRSLVAAHVSAALSPAAQTGSNESIKPAAAIPVENKVPVRAFVSKKGQAQDSVRDIFKTIGKSPRLTPAEKPEVKATPKGLFFGMKPGSGKKS